MSDRNLLSGIKAGVGAAAESTVVVLKKDDPRTTLVEIAMKEVGVREQTGRNDGARVEEYLRYTGLGKGHAWCAAYVSWVYGQAGFSAPRTAWSPSLFPAKYLLKTEEHESKYGGAPVKYEPAGRNTKTVLPGTVFGIYFPALKRIGHAGIVVRREGDWILTAEGNTNVNGSREGDGVYCKRRHRRTIAKFADWIKKKKIRLSLL